MKLPFDKIYVINLKSRQDRWDNMVKEFAKHNISMENIVRWNAVNGKNLTDQQLQENAGKTCFNFCNKGTIGCFLSHQNVWKDVVKHDYNKVLVLEDDVVFCDDIVNKMTNYYNSVPKDWDAIFAGSYGSSLDSKICWFTTRQNKIINDHVIKPCFVTGTHGLILNSNSCKKLLKALPKAYYHVDYSIVNYTDLNLYAFNPPLINQNDSGSDIQNSSETIILKILDDNLIFGFLPSAFFNSSLFKIGNKNVDMSVIVRIIGGLFGGFFNSLFPIIIFLLFLSKDMNSNIENLILIGVSYLLGIAIRKYIPKLQL